VKVERGGLHIFTRDSVFPSSFLFFLLILLL
jgi:hypothetical protein